MTATAGRPVPQPPRSYVQPDPLDLPSVAECLVRVEATRHRRRGPSSWHTGARELRAAELLHELLRAGLKRDVHLADFDAAMDLPAACYDTVVLLERVEATR